LGEEGGLNLFLRARASQAFEKVDSGRENPRKSKSNRPLDVAHFGAKPRLADDIQMTGCAVKGSVAVSSVKRRPVANLADLGTPRKNFAFGPRATL
jgi:hypothetical protein